MFTTVAMFLVWFVDKRNCQTALMSGKKSHLKTSAEILGLPWLSSPDKMRTKIMKDKLRCNDFWAFGHKMIDLQGDEGDGN